MVVLVPTVGHKMQAGGKEGLRWVRHDCLRREDDVGSRRF